MIQFFNYRTPSIFILVSMLGIMTGFFFTYTVNVNEAMLQVDGETYAQVQSLFNQTVRNPIFYFFFFGSGVISITTTLLCWKKTQQINFYIALIITILYVFGVIIYTKNVNLPLNHYTETWNLEAIPDDWKHTRKQWNNANLIRLINSGIAFVLSIILLIRNAIKS